MDSLLRYFQIRERQTTVGRELRGAIATFLTMAYILFVNAGILKQCGVPFPSSVACTALAAGICCILMGAIANFPLALASGMGLNAIVAFTVASKAGSWQAAMGLVVLDGLLTAVLVLVGLREAVMRAIPRELRLATGAGIGLFIAFIGLANSRIVMATGDLNHPIAPGDWTDPQHREIIVAIIGLLLTAAMMARKIPGAILIGIVATTVIAYPCGLVQLPKHFAMPSFEAAFHADVRGAMQWKLMPLLFAIIMVDFFDTLGTASAIAEQAGLVDQHGRIPGVRRILLVDSISAAIGGLLGASSVTSYIESAAGVAEGARTGLHSICVGVLFLLAIFLAPIAGIVPSAATAPALILVGFLMISQIAQIDFTDYEASIPAFITLLTIPLTYSIAHGIGYGFITFVVIKIVAGKFADVHPLMYAVTAAFVAYFVSGVA